MWKIIKQLRQAASMLRVAFGPTDLKKLLSHGRQFAAISAYKGHGKHHNKELQTELIKDLNELGYRSPVQFRAYWDTYWEKSWLVKDMTFEDAVGLGRQYDQDAILYKDVSGTLGIYDLRKGTVNLGFDPKTGDLDVLEDQFPSLVSKHKDWSYEAMMVWGVTMQWHRHPITKSALMAHLKSLSPSKISELILISTEGHESAAMRRQERPKKLDLLADHGAKFWFDKLNGSSDKENHMPMPGDPRGLRRMVRLKMDTIPLLTLKDLLIQPPPKVVSEDTESE